MSPYIHHRIPEIKQYANQLEWVENTLVERDSTEIVVNNVLIDLERRLDDDSFVQVLGESLSQRETQEHNEQQAKEGLQGQEESENPDILEEMTQTRQPEPIMSTHPII